jgi:uncharacterized protein (DUF697 family)
MNASWKAQILNPKVSDTRLYAQLEQARQSLPVPVYWLLGKTQSGKTSIIQALTGAERAVVGVGFRPCTSRAEVFDFPDPETAFVRFLDSKGLGEAEYDPQEDIEWCRQRAHLLMVVIKAMDHELDAVHRALQAIREAHPDWPVLVIQTCLHEGYPGRATEHVQPYPYADGQAFAGNLPPDLLRSLHRQRQQFVALNVRFVAVDFTRAEEGYTPQHYGLDALWAEIETSLPLGLRQILMDNSAQTDSINDVYASQARPHIIAYAISAGVLAMTPLPAVSVPLVITAQGKLLHSIASIYGLPLTMRSVSEVAAAVGVGSYGVGVGLRELAKLIPGWGSVISGLSTAAITYALGMTFCFYYAKTRRGEAFTAAMLKSVYAQQLQHGREILKQRFK